MKTNKHNIYLGLIAAFIWGSSIVSSCNLATAKNETIIDGVSIPTLLERSGELAKASEWPKTKSKVNELIEKIKAKPSDCKLRIQLANIYMNEARVTGDAYYHQAALKVLNSVLVIEPNNFDALTFEASIAMSLHQFAQAKTLANKALQINPYNGYVYGVLVDANVELGNYAQAIAMSDKMQSIKPSLEAYSRASYLREINGDVQGAIEAMKLAVIAGAPGSESGEWARVTLGDLYANNGMLDSAEKQYQTALVYRPNFPTALIGLAKLEKAKTNYSKAITYTEQAIGIVSEASYVSLLGELHALNGNTQKAKEINTDVIELLQAAEKEQNDTKQIVMKHNANRELANAHIQLQQFDKALQYALNDLALRPNNIDANELVAWIYYLNNDAKSAQPYATKMLSTNCKNPTTLYKAGLIYAAVGDASKGNQLMATAKAININVEAIVNKAKS
jgi:tetratricopeptide (TPR) repeat protein